MSKPQMLSWSGYLTLTCMGPKKAPNHPHTWTMSGGLTKGKPTVDANSIAVKVSVELPATLFTRPALQARITIPESAQLPQVLQMVIIDNIEEQVLSQTGFKLQIDRPE